MNQLASSSQLRMSLLRWALFIIPTVMFFGITIGKYFGPDAWFAELIKPAAQPPGWAFAVIWPLLYFMIALAFAMILNARSARYRGMAIGLFLVQLMLNFAWPLTFFGKHQVSQALVLIVAVLVLAIATTVIFGRVRRAAAWLMVPYLVWLSFATILNYQIDRLNPDAERLYVPAPSTQIGSIG